MLLDSTLDNPPSLCAEELHEILLVSHQGGNVSRRRFINALRALQVSRLYFQLGYSSVWAYADEVFHYGRTQVFEFLRVSKALLDLPKLTRAFEAGEVSWALVCEISRVTDKEHEEKWLELLRSHSVRAVLLELKCARKKNRKRPREKSFGLPGLPVAVRFEFSPEDHLVIEKGLKKVASEMALSLDGALPSPAEALLHILRRVLETEPAGSITEGKEEKGSSPFLIVYHQCPACLSSAVETEDGRVEISPEALERSTQGAEEVVIEEEESQAPEGKIDRPNTPRLRKLLRAREGNRCANPFCRRETGNDGHGHHICFRSKGGPTELQNEIWMCVGCHAVLHSGALTIERDPQGGLRFKARAESVTRSIRQSLESVSRMTEVRTVEALEESGHPDSGPNAEEDDVIEALVALGSSKKDARTAYERASRRLGGSKEPPSAEKLLKEALRRER